MKKRFYAMIMLMMAIPIMTGCNETTEEYIEEDATVVTFYAQDFEDWSNEHLVNMRKQFNAIKDDGLQLDIKMYQDEAYSDALTVARENNSAPDIFMVSYGNIYSTAVATGYAEPLDAWLDADYFEDLVPSVRERIRFNDHYYTYPQLTEPATLFFYRTDMFEQAGVTEVPTTWDELLDAAASVKAILGRGQYALGMPIGTALGWATYGMQYNTTGGLALNEAWTESLVDSQGYRELNGLFYDLYANGYCPAGNVSPTGYNDIIEALAQDKLAMTFAGSWSIAEIINTYPDMKDVIGVAPIPTIDGDQSKATASNGGWTYAISSTSQHKEEAARVLEWFFCEDAERTAGFFEAAAYSKAPVNQSVIDYIAANAPQELQDWLGVVTDVATKGIPEALYPWDISLAVATMFETMAIKADPSKGESFKTTTIENAIATADSAINTIITNPGFIGNPMLAQ